jgi:hypothetical protein
MSSLLVVGMSTISKVGGRVLRAADGPAEVLLSCRGAVLTRFRIGLLSMANR